MVDRRSPQRPRLRLLPDDPDVGWMPYVWLVYLLFIPTEAFYRQLPPLQWAAIAAGFAVFLGLYFRSYWVQGWQQIGIVAGMTLLGAVFAPWNNAATVFLVYAACAVPRIERAGAAYRNVAIYTVISGLICVALRLPGISIAYTVIVGGLLGAVVARNMEQKCTDAVLRLAHAEVERMAKVAERERIARDLHDVMGHTLSVIVLKSELAAKLAERDVARAAIEIREVEQIARETLSGLREAAGQIAGAKGAAAILGIPRQTPALVAIDHQLQLVADAGPHRLQRLDVVAPVAAMKADLHRRESLRDIGFGHRGHRSRIAQRA